MIRRLLIAAVLTAGAVLATALPAQAIPIADPGESVTYTFYSDATRTVEVGWWSYGTCGIPFDYGQHTAWFTIRYVNCGVF